MTLSAITAPFRKTMPSQLLTDRGFIYSNSASTNVADTIRRERERIAQEQLRQKLAADKAQQARPGIPPTTRRLRAGKAVQLTLPQL